MKIIRATGLFFTLPVKGLPTNVIDSKLVKFLDFEDTQQLRRHVFFNNQ